MDMYHLSFSCLWKSLTKALNHCDVVCVMAFNVDGCILIFSDIYILSKVLCDENEVKWGGEGIVTLKVCDSQLMECAMKVARKVKFAERDGDWAMKQFLPDKVGAWLEQGATVEWICRRVRYIETFVD